MNRRLQTASRAARAAGKLLREKFNTPRTVRSKGKRDIVTDADYAAESTVRDILLTRFPQDLFLSEEGDAAERQALWDQVTRNDDLGLWVVDPLDGTTNYARRQPTFSVSIALVRRGAVQVGVVYDPMRDELFAAERARGAYLNGQRIAASHIGAFANAVIGTEWARAQPLRERTAALLARMAVRVMSVRCGGSAALSLSYIAAGRLDAYFHLSLYPWDVAAGALLIEEAGGRVTTLQGEPWSVHSQAYVATNGHLHRQMLAYFRNR